MNQYPWWRYLLIVVLTVLGFVYALPNLPQYGDDYAVQVTTTDGTAVPATLPAKISSALTQQKVPFISVKALQHNVLVRFKESEQQTRARDVIQATLGKKYSVALNLAPKTPKWLQAIGAYPMKLGLDLRGGIHFLMQVDVASMLKERVTGDAHAIGNQLREKMIRYAGIQTSPQNGIVLRFRSEDARYSALKFLRETYPNYTYTQAMENGQYVVKANFSPDEVQKLQQYAVTQNITTLRNRVNDMGIAEPIIQQQGKNQISVDLPGIQDTARAKDMIGKVATVRLQLVDTEHDAATAAQTGIIPFGSTLYNFNGRPVLLKNQVVLHGTSITSAATVIGDDGRPAVAVRATGPEVNTFARITAESVGKPMATIYVETESNKQIVNGKLKITQKQVAKIINIATIQSGLGASFQITGMSSSLAAKNLALQLRSGAYSAPVTFIGEQVVGPSMGKANIRMGVLSCEIGTLAVVIFMLLYYRLFGFIADCALVLNVVFLIAVMSLMGFTLTLPGIAGIVLTVGMAVDANVLINERVREELRNGLSPQAAIYAGYGRAFSTIVDANVTTLIVAVVLFALGTGPVQNFAVTLTIGLLLSMMTSIFFTRAAVNLIYGKRQVKQLSIGIKV